MKTDYGGESKTEKLRFTPISRYTGKPDGVTEDEVSPYGESLDEFMESMEDYRKAIELPVLDYDTLEEVERENVVKVKGDRSDS